MTTSQTISPAPASTARVLFASLAGTAIEFFDFYIYATAAVLVFPQLFFPNTDATTATLQSFATFSIAFFARPIGAMVFGHFGDRIGRKATLVAALLTMGLSTVAIGLLPTYQSVGIWAPLLLALCRFLQGFGLGGEWGGAVLLATENAPPGRKAWFGMFPQLGAPIGFICSTGIFLVITETLTDQQFQSFGWRIPFIASALLVFVGLYVRLRISETPAFQQAMERNERVQVPLATIFKQHLWLLLLGTFGALATFVLFYLMTVFALSWGINALGFTRQEFLPFQIIGVVFFGITIPISAWLADRVGRWTVLLWATAAIAGFGLLFEPLFSTGSASSAIVFMILGLALMGFTYGPLGTALSEPFPVGVRYTGASLAFNLAGIFGASLAPYVATTLATAYGIHAVGLYLFAAAALTFLALLGLKRNARESTQHDELSSGPATGQSPQRPPSIAALTLASLRSGVHSAMKRKA